MNSHSRHMQLYDHEVLLNGLNNRIVFLEYLLISCFVSAANVLFFLNIYISAMVVTAEILALLYAFIQQKYVNYIVYYIIFMANCLEYPAFVGTDKFYNFKNFRIAGIGIGVYMLIPLIFGIVQDKKIRFVSKNLYIYIFSIRLILLNIIAMLVGLFYIFINDNNILGLEGIVTSYIGKIYTMMIIPIAFIFGFFGAIQREEENIYKIGQALQATLWGNVFQIIISLSIGISGSYGYLETIQASILYFIIPFTMLLYFYKNEVVFPKLTFTIGLIGSMFVIIYNTNGKLIMLFVIVMSIFIVLSFINNDMFAKSVSVAIVFVLIFWPTNIYSSIAIKPLYNAKLKEVIGLINIFQKNWLENVPQSSRVRIEEFRNVYIEFMKKPWIIITGKGYLGSIKDYTGYITNLNTYDGLCSEIEWTHKTFFNLHEITSYILTYGALGILFCINFLQTVIIHLVKENNIWILIGAYWFILFYGYSLTISTFSIAALLYGAWQVESINHTCRIYRYFNNLRLTSED